MTVLLSAQGLTKRFTSRPLFDGLSIDFRAGEKIGLIGPNGAGKSTLLKILADIEIPDAGLRTARRGARIGYVPQEDIFPPDATATEAIVAGLANEQLEDYEREIQAAIILTQLGFEDHDKKADQMSGGWRKRLAIARELARKPEFLLMDEPTNHLDLPGVVWLERLLRAATFGYLAATHDRAFLRAIADDIIEISRAYPGGMFRSSGGYDNFAENRDLFMEAQDRQREAVANQVRRETEWLGRKAAARTCKATSRIDAAMDRRVELAELQYRSSATGAAGIDFAGTGRQTKKLISATGVGKSLGGRTLFRDFNLVLAPGSVIGLLGANGSGKSTLLKILGGQLEPDTGSVKRAEGLRLEVFEQGRSSLDLNVSLRRALSPNADTVMYRGQPMHVGGWAKRFLFQTEQLELELSALSGGEQARVRIAQLMLRPADVLMLDEPTNDLDIPALEVLEESLEDFPGAVVLVSHDRDLMDRLCTEVVGLDDRGNAAMYGSVGQWLKAMEVQNIAEVKATAKSANAAAAAAKPKRLSYKEQQEFDGIEAAVLKAEETVIVHQAEVEKKATAGREVLKTACRELERAQQQVEKLYARWQELEAKRT